LGENGISNRGGYHHKAKRIEGQRIRPESEYMKGEGYGELGGAVLGVPIVREDDLVATNDANDKSKEGEEVEQRRGEDVARGELQRGHATRQTRQHRAVDEKETAAPVERAHHREQCQ